MSIHALNMCNGLSPLHSCAPPFQLRDAALGPSDSPMLEASLVSEMRFWHAVAVHIFEPPAACILRMDAMRMAHRHMRPCRVLTSCATMQSVYDASEARFGLMGLMWTWIAGMSSPCRPDPGPDVPAQKFLPVGPELHNFASSRSVA